ncbi:D-2-hydroxyacid dehydrogenase [Arcicella sp. LKC2W]|uniref:D-2-hydroxyacid dehydrogenase n=1 Tax=Arcicella sp. LKC2W TaxID=2984198 RepID=UPI002B1EC389|nr:D-2-hydroxyacid dehydrogenase [Arcicella sp. LKC2W]MEA5458442.1 D-2-hydroxyacid dehydrogenase [Arcicella sp. LKC2W]
MKIYIHTKFQESIYQQFRDGLKPKYEVIFGDGEVTETLNEQFLTCDICYGNVPLDWLNASSQLKWLQLNSTGLDPYQQLTEYQFQLTNLKGFFGQSVAETTVAGILAVYRRIDELTRLQTKNEWVGTPIRETLHLLHKAKVVILGSGAIGLKTQQLLSGFECETTVLNSKTISQLADYLPTTDILIATLPETKETIGLINKTYLDMLKPSALFVNVGRGSAVDENTLIEILKEEKILGAVLDVTELEPLPTESPLWNMPNVLLTQHSSGGWAEESADKVVFFLNNLARFEKGEELVNNVDLVKGY